MKTEGANPNQACHMLEKPFHCDLNDFFFSLASSCDLFRPTKQEKIYLRM